MSTSTESTLTEELPAAVMQQPRTTGMAKHYVRYSSATILMMATGLVSFPLLTRLLDNTQYGILGYYETWVLMTVAVIKLGAQHAILRMYPFGGDERRLTHFATNLVALPLAVSAGLWTLGMAVFAGVSWWRDIPHSAVLWCALMAIPLMVFVSHVEMTLRVSERSAMLTTTKVVARWTELVVVLTLIVLVQRSALAVYAGRIATMLLVVAFYVRWVRKHLNFSRASLDLGAYRESLIYGLPLVANEIAGAALASIDRLMLKHMLNDYASVGIYTIGYALAMQLGVLVNTPFWDAFTPALNRAYSLHDEAQVRAMKARVLVPVTYACVGVAVAIWTSGSDVLQMLSGPGKAASGEVFAWVGTMYAVILLLDLSGYGLLLRKRTGMVLLLSLVALVMNVGLNLLWIPKYGYMGAVYATVISYLVYGVSRCLACPWGLLQFPDRRTLLLALGAAGLFLVVIHACDLSRLELHWMRAASAGVLWLACYVLPVLALDSRLRRLIVEHWPQRLRR